jgi:hypothetical protein
MEYISKPAEIYDLKRKSIVSTSFASLSWKPSKTLHTVKDKDFNPAPAIMPCRVIAEVLIDLFSGELQLFIDWDSLHSHGKPENVNN